MKKVLLTGGSGFVGSNIYPFLAQRYEVYAPRRQELDVRDAEQVKNILKNEKYDIVVHLASPSPVRSAHLDSYDKLFEDCLKIYMNFYSYRDCCEKIIYSGSGAEFDKRRDLVLVSEKEFGSFVPADDYGRAKYIMNEMSLHSENIYNLRIFACYGPNEYADKFITHAIRCCEKNEPITIRQDCYFDYLYIDDYAKYLMFCIENKLKYHDYNASSGTRILLSDIARMVRKQYGSNNEIIILKEGFNKEYTASNKRIIDEMGGMEFISIENGIDKLIRWEKMKNNEKKSG